MAKYTKNPEVVDAVQWTKVGDHADVTSLDAKDDKAVCPICGQLMSTHGQKSVAAGMSNTICPGKWLITRENGLVEYLDDATFQARYTAAAEVEKS